MYKVVIGGNRIMLQCGFPIFSHQYYNNYIKSIFLMKVS